MAFARVSRPGMAIPRRIRRVNGLRMGNGAKGSSYVAVHGNTWQHIERPLLD